METENNILNAKTAGFGLSVAVSAILNTLLTFAKEHSKSLHDFMAKLLGHHWITHGVFIVLVFFILGFVFSHLSFAQKMEGKTLSEILVWSVILSGLGLFGWFLLVG